MQLTTIEQCKIGVTVFHPVWGKGEITFLNRWSKNSTEVTVKFAHCKHYFYTGIGEGYNHISHLYLFPIVTISQAEYDALKDAIGSKGFKLIQSLYNPEQ